MNEQVMCHLCGAEADKGQPFRCKRLGPCLLPAAVRVAPLKALLESPLPGTSTPVEIKPTNPKDAVAGDRVPLHLVSPIAKAYASIAQFLGMVKYGAWNWRKSGARASVYKAALERHMDAWWSGEEFDPVDGTPHLANALACLNILIECKERGNLVDDRPPAQDLRPAYRMVEELMPKIRERYAHLQPHHHTIEDANE